MVLFCEGSGLSTCGAVEVRSGEVLRTVSLKEPEGDGTRALNEDCAYCCEGADMMSLDLGCLTLKMDLSKRRERYGGTSQKT
jgi:hypothetical protein